MCEENRENLVSYVPREVVVERILPQIPEHRLFQLKPADGAGWESFGHKPGQFVQVSILGHGEAPISIASSPTRPDYLELCVRRAGRLTGALFDLEPGDKIGLRGPFGNGFDVEELKGHSVLFVAGGLGLAPLRSLLSYVLDGRKDFEDVILMYGSKNPDEVLFKYELLKFFEREDLKYLYSVDKDEEGIWKQHIGVVTCLFEHASFDVEKTRAVLCGPPVMYKFVVRSLLEKGMKAEQIFISLERHMKCGVGKCGHCAIGNKYCCTDGPVFRYSEVVDIEEAI